VCVSPRSPRMAWPDMSLATLTHGHSSALFSARYPSVPFRGFSTGPNPNSNPPNPNPNPDPRILTITLIRSVEDGQSPGSAISWPTQSWPPENSWPTHINKGSATSWPTHISRTPHR
jgi:hypothetical protein